MLTNFTQTIINTTFPFCLEYMQERNKMSGFGEIRSPKSYRGFDLYLPQRLACSRPTWSGRTAACKVHPYNRVYTPLFTKDTSLSFSASLLCLKWVHTSDSVSHCSVIL